ncbi:amino acid permease (plasmid) [Halorubrum sp. BOL3-1]|uniref:APC family permease n=1 Tax=Halorubrum sp. BOL3-1 TaxID=2497325 RepID=UPI001004FBC0|nr:amino acid permease [Halorubrum sp. BOL3-1]QAU14514.1 amino acid permease [Halorubrum sp. BOL3-1]
MGAEQGDRSPAASLGLLDATMVGIGAMIGAGIFVLTGLAAEIAGPAAILVFALNGGVTTFTALSYAELASAIPKNGGGYAYVRETFSDPVAFVMGWTRWFTYTAAGALYALGFSSNFVEFVHLYWAGLPSGPVWHVGYALLAVVSFVALNALSTEASGGAETIITLVKIGILGVFIIFGIGAVSPETFMGVEEGASFGLSEFFSQGTLKVLPAMGLTFIAFQGYDLIATVTEEVENPRKNIPRAIFLSLGVTVLIYLLVVGVAIGTLGAPRLGGAGEKAVVEAAVSFMPDVALFGASIGAALIAFGAVFSTISALNAVVIGSSRVAFAMGREGQLPSQLGNIHHDYGTPYSALMASAAIMLVATVVAPISLVGNLASLFSLLGFIVVNLAVIKLRRDQPSLNRPFEIPLYPAPPVLGCVLNLLLAAFISPLTWAVAVGWLLFGAVVYAGLNPGRVRVLLSRGQSADPDTESAGEPDLSEPVEED